MALVTNTFLVILIEQPADKETYGICWGSLCELNFIMVRGGRDIKVSLVTEPGHWNERQTWQVKRRRKRVPGTQKHHV